MEFGVFDHLDRYGGPLAGRLARHHTLLANAAARQPRYDYHPAAEPRRATAPPL